MRIGVVGASGRVGTHLVEAILSNPGLELAAALVSPNSKLIGTPVNGGSLEYRSAEAGMRSRCDVMIDFSTPAASLALQNLTGSKAIPMVIGTTGFSPEQSAELSVFSRYRPMLISANFAHGFEAFRLAAREFIERMPGAEPRIAETYHAAKKHEASGTSRLLARDLAEARGRSAGFAAPEPGIAIARRGDTVGINTIKFDMGSAEVVLTYTARTRATYAEGALAAARWLVSNAAGPGLYSLADAMNKSPSGRQE